MYLTEATVQAVKAYLEVRGEGISGIDDFVFLYRHKQISRELIRCRLKAAGQRTGVKVTPHMLRHTFATQLVNAGAKITTIQALLGHVRLNTTMTYARVHDKTVVDDFLRAMEVIEGEQAAVLERKPATEKAIALLKKLGQDGLNDEQQQLLAELRGCLVQSATETIVNEQMALPP